MGHLNILYIRWMSLAKHQSVTSDTRLTGSLNHSLQGHHPKLAKQLLNSENCEIDFLRQKNAQLQERVARLTATVGELEKNKVDLLRLNQKYVKIVNEYYRKGKTQGKENRQTNSALLSLEKDHRNLVKHCLNMEEQINNYSNEMQKYNQMKSHLLSVSHTNTKELIEQLRFLTDENKALKKENNRLSFQLEKSRQECIKLRKGKQQSEEKADLEGGQLERYKSLVNTIQQESSDKSNEYQAKIYQLQIKVQKLQAQLRREQQYLLKTTDVKRRLEIASVEYVHERDNLRQSLRDKKSKSRALHSSSFVC